VIDASFVADRPGTRYFEYEIQPRAQLRHNGDSVERLDHLLDRAVEARMISDVPFGVYLSGGIDSALILSYMSRYTEPVNTFSVDLVSSATSKKELSVAETVARQFKTNHHEILIDQKDAFDFLPKLVWHQDEPLADPVCIPLYFVSKLARDNGTIVVQVVIVLLVLWSVVTWAIMISKLSYFSGLNGTSNRLLNAFRSAGSVQDAGKAAARNFKNNPLGKMAIAAADELGAGKKGSGQEVRGEQGRREGCALDRPGLDRAGGRTAGPADAARKLPAQCTP